MGFGSFSDNAGSALLYLLIGFSLIPFVIPFIQRLIGENRGERNSAVRTSLSRHQMPSVADGSADEYQGEREDASWSSSSRQTQGDRDDYADYNDWSIDLAVPCEASLEIEYIDAAGLKTKRAVDVQYCVFSGDTSMLRGFCHLREASRAFRISRVQSAVDCETGEVIGDLFDYLKRRYEASPYASLERAFSDYKDNFRLLLYVGKADGQLRREERSVIYEFIRDVTGDYDLSAEMMKKWIDRLEVPSLAAFRQIVGRVAKQEKSLVDSTLKVVLEIHDTKKSPRPAEIEAIEYIQKRFID